MTAPTPLSSQSPSSPNPPPAPAPPQPPFIPIPKIHNFRALTHPRLPQNLIFRCADPSPITSEGTSALHTLNIGTIFDLRSAAEAASKPYSIPGVRRVFAPVFPETATSPVDLAKRLAGYAEEGNAGFVRAYGEILENGRTGGAYGVVFRHVLEMERGGEGFIVHCTGGKDRTGVVVALMMSVVGVGDEEVAEEYQLTEIGLREWVEEYVPAILQSGVWGDDEAKVRRALGARKEVMLEFLEMLREKWGGAEGYIRDGLGFREEEVERIKKNLMASVEEQQ